MSIIHWCGIKIPQLCRCGFQRNRNAKSMFGCRSLFRSGWLCDVTELDRSHRDDESSGFAVLSRVSHRDDVRRAVEYPKHNKLSRLRSGTHRCLAAVRWVHWRLGRPITGMKASDEKQPKNTRQRHRRKSKVVSTRIRKSQSCN
jgi:hypothetical protein